MLPNITEKYKIQGDRHENEPLLAWWGWGVSGGFSASVILTGAWMSSLGFLIFLWVFFWMVPPRGVENPESDQVWGKRIDSPH